MKRKLLFVPEECEVQHSWLLDVHNLMMGSICVFLAWCDMKLGNIDSCICEIIISSSERNVHFVASN